MSKIPRKKKPDDSLKMNSLWPVEFPTESPLPKKLTPENDSATIPNIEQYEVEILPSLILPTRWENLRPKLGSNSVSLRTIVRQVPEAMKVVRSLVSYLQTTNGCQVLVMRASSGSGKTTFLNTLPFYMVDIHFHLQTIEIQNLNEEKFGETLWNIKTESNGINLISLEGREKPESISDKYIQNVLADINRFARSRNHPILFVIPTIEEEVARKWCSHGAIGDLIPEGKLYQGSRWYNFPGVPKEHFIEIASETVSTLNPPHGLYDFGVSADEVKILSDNSDTIGEFIQKIATKHSERRIPVHISGKRERVWFIFVSPDGPSYDRNYHLVNGFVLDEKMKVSPTKLVSADSTTTTDVEWRSPEKWVKLLATLTYLDVRLINMPITTVTTAILSYGTESIIQSYKNTKLEKYKEQIISAKLDDGKLEWNSPLVERRNQKDNAMSSMEKSNLFYLLKNMPARGKKGGNLETALQYAQYLHFFQIADVQHVHNILGMVLKDLLKQQMFSGFADVVTEIPLVKGQTDPVPDVTIHTDTDSFALEFHFMQKTMAPSEMSRYALAKLSNYMRALPHLNSQLKNM